MEFKNLYKYIEARKKDLTLFNMIITDFNEAYRIITLANIGACEDDEMSVANAIFKDLMTEYGKTDIKDALEYLKAHTDADTKESYTVILKDVIEIAYYGKGLTT